MTAVSQQNPTLAAGTPYWLVTAGPGTDTVWDFNATGDLSAGGNLAFNLVNSPTGPWMTLSDGFTRSAFEIDGDTLRVPAPSRPTKNPPKAPLTATPETSQGSGE